MRRAALFLFTVVFSLFMSGCGSQTQVVTPTPMSNPTPSSVPVSLSVTDDPPAGVTVLFFQLNITGASLTTASSGSVSLLSSTNPIPVNVTQLQTDRAFLGNANVAAGTYNGLNLTFSNPQLTIYNGTGSTIGSGANACANNTVCQLQPAAQNMSLTLNSTPPFPVTLTANSPLAFMIDIHLDTVIQSDLSVNLGATNGVTISQLPTPPTGKPFPHLGHLWGTIQSINNSTSPNGFTLQTGFGKTFNIDVNDSTTYSNFPASAACTTSAETFSCLATQQVVKVEVSEQSDGTLLASEVDYVQLASQMLVEGNIIRLNTTGGNTVMDLVPQRGWASPNSLPLGHRVRVTVPSGGVTYAIDSGSFTLPSSGLSFASASDLIVGQEVSVVVQGSVTPATGSGSWTTWSGPGPATFTTSSITLEPSQITGSVAALPATGQLSFTLSTLPFFFVPPAAASTTPVWAPVNITVQTTAATTFTNFTTDDLSGLAMNDIVSVQGWVFSTPSGATNITLAAETVDDRPGPIPLF